MDYFAYQRNKEIPKIFIQNDKLSNVRYSAALFTPNDDIVDSSSLLSTSLPSPPSTPQIAILPSLSLPTNFFLESDHKRKRGTTSLHVLIVDDNPINLQILSRLLSLHLHSYIEHIELVKSGIKALEVLKCRPFDIIMMDIEMPILNGIETTQHIRSSIEFDILPTNRKIPIVAVTTNDSTSWRKIYSDIGMNGCIGKPILTLELKTVLSKVLEIPSIISPSTPE